MLSRLRSIGIQSNANSQNFGVRFVNGDGRNVSLSLIFSNVLRYILAELN